MTFVGKLLDVVGLDKCTKRSRSWGLSWPFLGFWLKIGDLLGFEFFTLELATVIRLLSLIFLVLLESCWLLFLF